MMTMMIMMMMRMMRMRIRITILFTEVKRNIGRTTYSVIQIMKP